MNLLLAIAVFTIIGFLILFVIICRKLMVRCPSVLQSIVQRIERKIFWNALLRACLESYLSICINFFVQAN